MEKETKERKREWAGHKPRISSRGKASHTHKGARERRREGANTAGWVPRGRRSEMVAGSGPPVWRLGTDTEPATQEPGFASLRSVDNSDPPAIVSERTSPLLPRGRVAAILALALTQRAGAVAWTRPRAAPLPRPLPRRRGRVQRAPRGTRARRGRGGVCEGLQRGSQRQLEWRRGTRDTE